MTNYEYSNTDDVIDVRDVIARFEELEQQKTPRYVAGWSMPGYMPDNPPAEFDDADDAREYLAEEMRRAADDLETAADSTDDGDSTAEKAQELRDAADALENLRTEGAGAEFGRTVGEYYYFISLDGEMGLDEDDQKEFDALETLLQDLCGNGGDEQWRGDWYPVTLIRESHFKDYAQQLAEDIGAINSDAQWPNTCIDWDQAARELKHDYSAVDIDGETYYYR